MAYPNNNNTKYKNRNADYNGQKFANYQSSDLSSDDKKTIQKIIQDDKNAAELVIFAKEKANSLKSDDMSSSQLRNIFGEFRKIEAFWEKDKDSSQRRLRLVQPKLAYLKARDKKTGYFCAIMTEAIDNVFESKDRDKSFINCINLLEALVAYHKSIGGRE